MTDIPKPDLIDLVEAYHEQFGDSVPAFGLPAAKLEAAADALMKAMEDDKPFADGAAFYKAIGLEQPPANAVT